MKNTYSNKILLNFILLFSFIAISNSFAATKTASSGAWGTAGTWSPSGVPAAGDDVIIPNGISVTLTGASYSCNSLTLSGTGTLSFTDNAAARTLTVASYAAMSGSSIIDFSSSANGASLSIGSSLTMDGTSNLKNTSGTNIPTITVTTTYSVVASASGVTIGGVNLTVTGLTTVGTNATLQGGSSTTGTKAFNGGVTLLSGSIWNNTAAETFTVTGDMNLTGATLKGSSAGTFNVSGKLIINNGSTSDIQQVSLSITGLFQIDGPCQFSTSTGGTKTFKSGITLSSPNGAFTNVIGESYTVGGNITNNGTWNSPSGSSEVVDMTPSSAGNANYTISGSNPIYLWRLRTNNNGGTTNVTLTGTLYLLRTAGTCLSFTGSAGTFTMGNGGYLHLSGGSAGSDPVNSSVTFNASGCTNTVEYNQAAAQLITNATTSSFCNLVISGGGGKYKNITKKYNNLWNSDCKS